MLATPCISILCLLQSMPGDYVASEPSKSQCPAEAQSTREASALQAHVQAQNVVVQAAGSAASAIGPAHQPVSLSRKQHEMSAYTADLLTSSSGQEVSFEEVRAASWFARQERMQQVRFCMIVTDSTEYHGYIKSTIAEM